jgi:hypothetical protein
MMPRQFDDAPPLRAAAVTPRVPDDRPEGPPIA